MVLSAGIVAQFLLCISSAVLARPSRTIPYFPQYHPRDIGDVGVHAEDDWWHTYTLPEEPENQLRRGKYVYAYQPSGSAVGGGGPWPSREDEEDIRPSIPVYQKEKAGGYFPSSLNDVYWWNKRFGDITPLDDTPTFPEDDYENNSIPVDVVKKRDYTAAQLVNMLKALAKARRQRGIRIAGKGLRFGISR